MNKDRIQSHTLQNNNGMSLTVLNYGAIIQKLIVPDKNKREINVVLGYANPADYFHNPHYLGACIGPYAGRISKGEFSIGKETYKVHHKDGVHLHGEESGFNQFFWDVEEFDNNDEPFIRLSHISNDLEGGYPGNVKAEVTYQLTNDNTLIITFTAVTDKVTILNLTNHSYFNLGNNTSTTANRCSFSC